MSLINDPKLYENEPSGPKLRVAGSFSFAGNLITVDWDYCDVEYPLATREIYNFYKGGSSGTFVFRITVNYLAADKNDITNVFGEKI